MRYKYIAIEREYGSGGTEIAKKAAAQCEIPCYGREILNRVAEHYHMAPEEIDQYEESATGSLLYTLYLFSKAQSGDSEMLTREGKVFLAEQKVIQRLAADGKAMFLGHCAAEALQEQDNVLRVFIRADAEYRLRRIVQVYGIPEEQAESVMRRYDKKRSNYYSANTAKRWNSSKNYELVLDSGKLGVAACAAAISGVFCAG